MNTTGSYFDSNGQPLPEAAPFLEYRAGSDAPEAGPEMRVRRTMLTGSPGIFDDELILQSLVEGWSIEETRLHGLEIEAELNQQKSHREARNGH